MDLNGHAAGNGGNTAKESLKCLGSPLLGPCGGMRSRRNDLESDKLGGRNIKKYLHPRNTACEKS
jgi:hypothetical protein